MKFTNVDVLVLILTLAVLALGFYILLSKKNTKENMENMGDDKEYDVFKDPDYKFQCERDTRCTPENNCFKGMPLRSQVYQNVCDPLSEKGLLRDKKQLTDNCLRSLGNPYNTENLVCKVNKHDQRKCQWEKKN